MNGESALRATRALKYQCRTNRPYRPFIRMKGLAIKSESALSTGYCLHDEPQQMVHQPARPFKTVYISFPTYHVDSAAREFPPQLFQ